MSPAETAQADLLTAARAGDGDAFAALVAPHRRVLHLHCYRMLGSLDDAEEAMQEALLRAWRSLDGYEGRAPLRHWLYRITTTTCLKTITARNRQPQPVGEIGWLQPYPDRLLDQIEEGDPAAAAERRDSVALAFVVALQRLPANQRAVLLLRDVLSFTAREVATLLDSSVPAVNSALQRARATLPSSADRAGERPLSPAEKSILDRFVDAWHRRDIDALAALLREDVTLSMPPQPLEFVGRDAVVRFFATVPADGRLDLIRLVPTRANGQPALAAYLPDEHDACRGYGIMVLDLTGDAVSRITWLPRPQPVPRLRSAAGHSTGLRHAFELVK